MGLAKAEILAGQESSEAEPLSLGRGGAAWRFSGRSRGPPFLQCGGEEAARQPGAPSPVRGLARRRRRDGLPSPGLPFRVQVLEVRAPRPGGVARHRRLLAFQLLPSAVVSPMTLPPVPPHRPRARRWRPLRALECVLLGDGGVGKTSLALSYSANGFPARHVPTALDRFSAVVQVDGAPIRLQLCDTAGQDEFDALWQACCPKPDICLLCFSVVAPISFRNIVDKWYPEVRRHCPSTPLLLVGTQSDLRQDVKVLIALSQRQEKPVPPTAGCSLARKLDMAGYMECSALTQQNLKEVFDTAIVLGLRAGEGPKGQRAPPSCIWALSKDWWNKYVCLR